MLLSSWAAAAGASGQPSSFPLTAELSWGALFACWGSGFSILELGSVSSVLLVLILRGDFANIWIECMRPQPSSAAQRFATDVEELTLQLRGCTISVRFTGSASQAAQEAARAPSPTSSLGGFSVVAEVAQAGVPLAGSPREPEGSNAARLAVLDLTTAQELETYDLGHLASLGRTLGNAGPGWTGRARIARAFRAGVSAALVLSGPVEYQSSSAPLNQRNRYYICLRTSSRPNGFWTLSSSTFFAEVRGPSGERFGHDVVSHAFPSRSECEAFLAGARRPWPPEL